MKEKNLKIFRNGNYHVPRFKKKSKINSQNLNYTYCNKRGRYLRTVVEHFEKKKKRIEKNFKSAYKAIKNTREGIFF